MQKFNRQWFWKVFLNSAGLKVKLTVNQAEFGALLFLFGGVWISPGCY